MTVLITTLCLCSIVAATLVMAFKRIPEGQVYTLHRRDGVQARLLTPGTHWIVPLRDRVAHKISLTGHTLKIDAALDEFRRAGGVVYWQVLDPEQADAVIDEAETLICRQMLEALRTESAVDPIMRSVHLKNRLNDTLRAQGLLVTRVDIRVAVTARAAA